ncbi:MAG: hypothetical protein KC483_10765 [Nitrosarchaeum sp.]|nr:hypothetical protein [Nitrosarchaeum sp.]
MSRIKLNAHTNGEIITPKTINDIHASLKFNFIGRDSQGEATGLDGNLGTSTYGWNVLYCKKLFLNNVLFSTQYRNSRANDILSGPSRANSSRSNFLMASGNSASVIIDGSLTPIVYKVNGGFYRLTSKITLGSLSLAPSTNNTCDYNGQVSGTYWTRSFGNDNTYNKQITVNNMGSEISSLALTFQAFEFSDGSSSEYLIMWITNSTNLRNGIRAYLDDSDGVQGTPLIMTTGDTFTLLKLNWIFLNKNETTASSTSTEPIVSSVEPSSPSTNDYWYDLANDIWKVYNGSAFVDSESVYIGIAACDDSNCVAARSLDYTIDFNNEGTLLVEKTSTTIVSAKKWTFMPRVVNSNIFQVYEEKIWNGSTSFASVPDTISTSFSGTGAYYAYLTEQGVEKISDIPPIYFHHKQGFYHNAQNWKCIARIWVVSGFIITVTPFYQNIIDYEPSGLQMFGFNATSTGAAAVPYTSSQIINNCGYCDDSSSFYLNHTGLYRCTVQFSCTIPFAGANVSFTSQIYVVSATIALRISTAHQIDIARTTAITYQTGLNARFIFPNDLANQQLQIYAENPQQVDISDGIVTIEPIHLPKLD